MKTRNRHFSEQKYFNGDKAQLKHLKEFFRTFIIHSKQGPNYFIGLLEYSKCRPHQQDISKELVECLYFCFPEQINEIQKNTKNTEILRFIIFPEEFPMKENKEQNEMFLLLEKDDIDGFISFLSNNPTIDNRKTRTRR